MILYINSNIIKKAKKIKRIQIFYFIYIKDRQNQQYKYKVIKTNKRILKFNKIKSKDNKIRN